LPAEYKGALYARAAPRQNEDDNEDEQEEELALGCASKSNVFVINLPEF
jgi:hypothetical protein